MANSHEHQVDDLEKQCVPVHENWVSIGHASSDVSLFVLLLYVQSQQLWSLRDGHFT